MVGYIVPVSGAGALVGAFPALSISQSVEPCTASIGSHHGTEFPHHHRQSHFRVIHHRDPQEACFEKQ